ncbi:hypothetical protein [Candidatus Enterococcus courvalinii]|nr:hypothetical protein [Enterococcus sp. MSG2901]
MPFHQADGVAHVAAGAGSQSSVKTNVVQQTQKEAITLASIYSLE